MSGLIPTDLRYTDEYNHFDNVGLLDHLWSANMLLWC